MLKSIFIVFYVKGFSKWCLIFIKINFLGISLPMGRWAICAGKTNSLMNNDQWLMLWNNWAENSPVIGLSYYTAIEQRYVVFKLYYFRYGQMWRVHQDQRNVSNWLTGLSLRPLRMAEESNTNAGCNRAPRIGYQECVKLGWLVSVCDLNHFAWFSLLIGKWPICAGKQRKSLMDNATKLSETSEMINTTHTV